METINNSEVLKNSISEGNTCLKFSAEWCGPCRVMGETIASIEGDYPNINFIEVDVDEADDSVISEYKVRNIPVLFFIKNGEILDKNVGVMSKEVLVNKLINVF